MSDRQQEDRLEAGEGEDLPVECPGTGMPSILSADLRVIGNLESLGPVQIEGRVEGDVNSPLVTIGEGARIDGSVTAEEVQIFGSVAGWVRAREVAIKENGRVEGSIQHEELIISPNRGPVARKIADFGALTDRDRWLLIRNLALVVAILLMVYFVGHSAGWQFVENLPDFLVPILGDQNIVVLLGFAFVGLVGFAWAKAEQTADSSVRKRIVLLERRIAQLRQPTSAHPRLREVLTDESQADLVARLEAAEQRIQSLSEDNQALKAERRVETAVRRQRPRRPLQRGAGS